MMPQEIEQEVFVNMDTDEDEFQNKILQIKDYRSVAANYLANKYYDKAIENYNSALEIFDELAGVQIEVSGEVITYDDIVASITQCHYEAGKEAANEAARYYEEGVYNDMHEADAISHNYFMEIIDTDNPQIIKDIQSFYKDLTVRNLNTDRLLNKLNDIEDNLITPLQEAGINEMSLRVAHAAKFLFHLNQAIEHLLINPKTGENFVNASLAIRQANIALNNLRIKEKDLTYTYNLFNKQIITGLYWLNACISTSLLCNNYNLLNIDGSYSLSFIGALNSNLMNLGEAARCVVEGPLTSVHSNSSSEPAESISEADPLNVDQQIAVYQQDIKNYFNNVIQALTAHFDKLGGQEENLIKLEKKMVNKIFNFQERAEILFSNENDVNKVKDFCTEFLAHNYCIESLIYFSRALFASKNNDLISANENIALAMAANDKSVNYINRFPQLHSIYMRNNALHIYNTNVSETQLGFISQKAHQEFIKQVANFFLSCLQELLPLQSEVNLSNNLNVAAMDGIIVGESQSNSQSNSVPISQQQSIGQPSIGETRPLSFVFREQQRRPNQSQPVNQGKQEASDFELVIPNENYLRKIYSINPSESSHQPLELESSTTQPEADLNNNSNSTAMDGMIVHGSQSNPQSNAVPVNQQANSAQRNNSHSFVEQEERRRHSQSNVMSINQQPDIVQTNIPPTYVAQEERRRYDQGQPNPCKREVV